MTSFKYRVRWSNRSKSKKRTHVRSFFSRERISTGFTGETYCIEK